MCEVVEEQEKKVEEDDFIGRRFGKDGQLEVVGWFGERSAVGTKLYTLKCHRCAEDVELFGDAVFTRPKGDILRGFLPCGCSEIPKWTEEQQKIRAERAARSRRCTLKGFLSFPVNSKTKLMLECNQCGYAWDSCTLSHLIRDNGCPACGRERIGLSRTKPDDEIISGFLNSGCFQDGTIFWRSDKKNALGYTPYWHYSCPRCSHDEYVQQGLCTGIFESHNSHLRRGKLACRCSKNFKWTQAQREYQINNYLLEVTEKYRFHGWETGYKTINSRLYLKCEEHGIWPTNVGNLLHAKHLCPSCMGTGFNKEIGACVYVLQAHGGRGFTGYGISNVPDSRLALHNRNLKKAGFSLGFTHIVHCTGQQAWDIEKEIKRTFPLLSQNIEGFKTEATEFDLYYDVVDFAEELLEKLKHT